MKTSLTLAGLLGLSFVVSAQSFSLNPVKVNAATAVKHQGTSSACWDYSMTSLVESESMRKGLGEFDLSEMYTVRCVYLEKAKNYILRQGKAHFSAGGLGHDLINAMAKHGAVPRTAFKSVSGEIPDHRGCDQALKAYLDGVLNQRPIATDWLKGFEQLLDRKIGIAPSDFVYHTKAYTPKTFSQEVLKFSVDDYISLTSFTQQPYYTSFILPIPDNWANGHFFNLPLNVLISLAKSAILNGYTLMWDTDATNGDYQHAKGLALLYADRTDIGKSDPDVKERPYSVELRQELFESLATEDNHLMHIVGLDKSPAGKLLFRVKDSFGSAAGPLNGYLEVSEPYFAINTVSLVVPKSALPSALRKKLKL